MPEGNKAVDGSASHQRHVPPAEAGSPVWNHRALYKPPSAVDIASPGQIPADGSCMKKIVLLLAVVILIFTGATQGGPGDVSGRHASGEWSWFAHVTRVQGIVPTNVVGSNEQTECFVLQNAPGQKWKSVGTMPGRAVALASRSSQLAILMADGQWVTLWSEGSSI